jgi:hypothetical protein
MNSDASTFLSILSRPAGESLTGATASYSMGAPQFADGMSSAGNMSSYAPVAFSLGSLGAANTSTLLNEALLQQQLQQQQQQQFQQFQSPSMPISQVPQPFAAAQFSMTTPLPTQAMAPPPPSATMLMPMPPVPQQSHMQQQQPSFAGFDMSMFAPMSFVSQQPQQPFSAPSPPPIPMQPSQQQQHQIQPLPSSTSSSSLPAINTEQFDMAVLSRFLAAQQTGAQPQQLLPMNNNPQNVSPPSTHQQQQQQQHVGLAQPLPPPSIPFSTQPTVPQMSSQQMPAPTVTPNVQALFNPKNTEVLQQLLAKLANPQQPQSSQSPPTTTTTTTINPQFSQAQAPQASPPMQRSLLPTPTHSNAPQQQQQRQQQPPSQSPSQSPSQQPQPPNPYSLPYDVSMPNGTPAFPNNPNHNSFSRPGDPRQPRDPRRSSQMSRH